MARTYRRDSNGRFSSGGGMGRQRPSSRPAPRGRNRLTRDNSGRITGTGDGATARGGRLRTGAGRLRATQTAKLRSAGGKIRKPKGLNPQPAAKLKKELAYSRMREVNRHMADRPDMAQVNITGRFTGQSGKRFAASISKAAAQSAAQQRAQMMKPKAQVRAETAARKAAKEAAALAKPKRTRTPLSKRTSRAKRIVKEREMKIRGTLRQWENSRRVQGRALAIYAEQSRAGKRIRS